MPASALAPLLATAFTPVAGAAAFQGIGLSLAGGLLAGIGQAKMEESRMEKEEAAKVAEEQRMQATYEGSADAMEEGWRVDEERRPQQGVERERERAQSNRMLKLGEMQQPQRPGQQYRSNNANRAPRFKYDPQTGRIVTQ